MAPSYRPPELLKRAEESSIEDYETKAFYRELVDVWPVGIIITFLLGKPVFKESLEEDEYIERIKEISGIKSNTI